MQFNKLTQGQERIIRHQAHSLQSKADRITAFRKKYSPVLGVAIAATEPRWSTTVATIKMWHGDHADGKHAKQAQKEMAKITGKVEPLSNGHIEDPKADKVLSWSLIGGVMIRSALKKDWKTTAIVGAAAATTYWRDKKMAETRQFVADNNLDISVAAINVNRAKTALQATSETLLISPAANNQIVKDISLAGLVIGTALGVYGWQRYHNDVMQAHRAREAVNTALCPDEIEPPVIQYNS